MLSVFCGRDELVNQEMEHPPSSKILEHLNKNSFPFSPASASRVCLLMAAGTQTLLWFGNSFDCSRDITLTSQGWGCSSFLGLELKHY